MSRKHIPKSFLLLLFFALVACTDQGQNNLPLVEQASSKAKIEITHVPNKVYTSVQGGYLDPENPPAGALTKDQQLTWLFHLVFNAPAESLRIENIDVEFVRNGKVMWKSAYPRSYLKNLTWLEGGIRYDTEYFLTNIEFVDNHMASVEKPTSPDIPAGSTVTWARFNEAQLYFGRIDAIKFNFEFQNDKNERQFAEHTVPIQEWDQNVRLRLPFDGLWVANSGNDLSTGHRRTGLNGLTTYGWDFMKVGEDGRTFRTDGSTPSDYYTYNAEVLAPGDGEVVHVRNDIEEYGIGITPPRERLETDGDVFAGNLVIIDHGNGEYTLTSHMRDGTITVKVGDQVKAGQYIGQAGNSGVSMVPHIHINMMDRAQWLEARGIPSLFSDFERVQFNGSTEAIESGNPMTAWYVRPTVSD
jgi:murein DD-endopeptidase MepM/ murein hydrolase activator NlpD